MVRLFLIRHSKSCANHVRHVAGTEDHTNPLVAASQELRDPELSAVGRRMAAAYGSPLQDHLKTAGFALTPKVTIVGSSELRRARQTAGLLFPGFPLETYPHFTEHGAIPENTPAGRRYKAPDWTAFVRHLHDTHPTAQEFIVVGHGSFLRSAVWPSITGQNHKTRFSNLEGFIVNGHWSPTGRLIIETVIEVPYTGSVKPDGAPDKCTLPAKVAAHIREMPSRRHRTRKQRKSQHGGAAMPLAYFQNGAQFHGTTADATGTGIGGSMTGAWARAPIQQTGGAKDQCGGFSPSIMGSFAANGLRYVLPIAGYTGYRMLTRKRSLRNRRA
jgi:broad specificity phosphatase PhoE